jgi:hypothetical protein
MASSDLTLHPTRASMVGCLLVASLTPSAPHVLPWSRSFEPKELAYRMGHRYYEDSMRNKPENNGETNGAMMIGHCDLTSDG